MYVSNRKLKIRFGRKQDFIDMWNTAVGTRLKRQKGFQTAFLLSSPDSDEIVIMTTWDSEADHKIWRASETYRQVITHMGGLTEKRLGDSFYEVALEINPETT